MLISEKNIIPKEQMRLANLLLVNFNLLVTNLLVTNKFNLLVTNNNLIY